MIAILTKQNIDEVKEELGTLQFCLVYTSLLIGVFLVCLDITIVPAALPTIATGFGALSKVSWVGVGYLLTSTATTLIYGKCCDISGRKLTFTAALLFFLSGYLICSLANNMDTVIAGRVVSGLGSSGISTTALIIVADITSLKQRGKFQGLIASMLGLSSVVGPLLGGYFVDNLSWRWCFYFSLIVGLVNLIMITSFFHPKLKFKASKLNLWSAFVLVLACTSFILPLQLGGSIWQWSDVQTIVLLCLVPVLFALFVWVDIRSADPILPKEVFENYSVPLILGIHACVGVVYLNLVYFIPLFIQLVIGDSAYISGTKTIAMFLSIACFSILSGLTVSLTGRYKAFFFVGPILLITGQSLLSTMKETTNTGTLIGYMMVAGFGVGCLLQVRVLSIQASVSHSMVAIATASGNFFYNLGATLGLAISGSIFNNSLVQQLGGQLAQASRNPKGVRALPAERAAIIIKALSNSLSKVYYFPIACACIILVLGFFVQEYRIQKQKAVV